MLRGLIRCSLLMALLAFALGARAEPGFRIQSAELRKEGGQYLLHSDIDFQFSDTAIEALKNGVPLSIVARLKVTRQRRYWLNQTVLNESRWMRIRYHPLAKSFQLSVEHGAAPQNFASLPALISAMGSIRGWPMLDASVIQPGEEYWASLSVSLDIESLPLPLRPVAYVSPSWYLASQRFTWRFSDG